MFVMVALCTGYGRRHGGRMTCTCMCCEVVGVLDVMAGSCCVLRLLWGPRPGVQKAPLQTSGSSPGVLCTAASFALLSACSCGTFWVAGRRANMQFPPAHSGGEAQAMGSVWHRGVVLNG
jgi:hypothetical protein